MLTTLLTALLFLHGSSEPIRPTTLTWDYFRAEIPANEPTVAARSSMQLVIETEDSAGKLNFVIYAEFIPDEAFVRVRTDAVLAHENVHWSIARLCALECMAAAKKYQNTSVRNLSVVQALYTHYAKEIDRLNDLYDRETNHGLNHASQIVWDIRVIKQLKKWGNS